MAEQPYRVIAIPERERIRLMVVRGDVRADHLEDRIRPDRGDERMTGSEALTELETPVGRDLAGEVGELIRPLIHVLPWQSLRVRHGQRIEIVRGDIAQVAADAIVNAANDHLWMGAGVAGALKRAGGDEIEREAMAKGPIGVGDAIATSAGRLPAKWVIHAAAMGQDLRTDAEKIRLATASALRVADEIGARSIVFPALGTGVGGFPLEECARIVVDAVRAHLARGSRIERVVFALRGDDAYRAFEERVG